MHCNRFIGETLVYVVPKQDPQNNHRTSTYVWHQWKWSILLGWGASNCFCLPYSCP